MTHQCPKEGCTKSVNDRMFSCSAHWWVLPAALRSAINGEYRAHGESAELRALHQQAIEVWAE